MLMITELLTPTPGPLWRLVKQAGIDHVVTLLDGGEQLWRWPEPGQEDGPPPFVAPPRGERAWDRPALARLQAAYREYGLELAVIEDTAPMDAVRLGTTGRDEQISWLHDQIRAMGELGIGTLCYNWHAVTGWARTHHDVPLRGGARSGGYDDATMRRAAPVAEPGSISTDQLWAAHEYFLRAVVPVAEEAGVRICLHPDDPPLPEVRGVPRIMGTPAAFDRVLATVPSAYSGITVCQGNFTLMTDDLPALIRRWGAQGKIFFALQGRGRGRQPVHRGIPRRRADRHARVHAGLPRDRFRRPDAPGPRPGAGRGEQRELRVRHPRPTVRGRLHHRAPRRHLRPAAGQVRPLCRRGCAAIATGGQT